MIEIEKKIVPFIIQKDLAESDGKMHETRHDVSIPKNPTNRTALQDLIRGHMSLGATEIIVKNGHTEIFRTPRDITSAATEDLVNLISQKVVMPDIEHVGVIYPAPQTYHD